MKINLNVVFKDLIKKEPQRMTDIESKEDLENHIGFNIFDKLCTTCQDEIRKAKDIVEDKIFTLREACIRSLLANFNLTIYPNEAKLSEKEKYARYKLFKKIDDSGENDHIFFESEEITLLKNLIRMKYGTAIFGQAADMLEQKEKEKPKDKVVK